MKGRQYRRVPGSLIEDLGEAWAAFSPSSGETHLINHESALLLTCLAQVGPADSAVLAREMAADTGVPADTLEARLNVGWAALLEAGMVQVVADTTRGAAKGANGGGSRPDV